MDGKNFISVSFALSLLLGLSVWLVFRLPDERVSILPFGYALGDSEIARQP